VKSFGRLITLAAVVLGVIIVYQAAPIISEMLVGHSLSKKISPGETVLGTVPGDWAFVSAEGKQVSFKDFRGKVVFLNMWATWCGPCVMEMPSILKLQAELSKDGIEFVLLSTEGLETIQGFLRSKGWDGGFYVAPQGPPPDLLTNALPTTFVVNKRSEIVFRQVGAVDWSNSDVKELLIKLSQEAL